MPERKFYRAVLKVEILDSQPLDEIDTKFLAARLSDLISDSSVVYITTKVPSTAIAPYEVAAVLRNHDDNPEDQFDIDAMGRPLEPE